MRRRSVAEPAIGAELAPTRRKFGMRDLWRTALWGLAAAGALSLVVYTGSTNAGSQRLMLATAQMHGLVNPSGVQPPRPLDAKEGQRLAATVRVLTDDRDRLLARIAALEQNLQDVTGTIARVSQAQEAAAQPPPTPIAAAPETAPSADDTTASVSTAGVPAPRRPPAPAAPAPDNAGKTEFGLDIGSAGTIEGLRALWATAQRRHGAVLEGLKPIVHLRDSRRPGGIELRLVAGPLPSAASAARLCATLTAAGAACQPSVFDGQRLAAR
jgi:hypothetical protein